MLDRAPGTVANSRPAMPIVVRPIASGNVMPSRTDPIAATQRRRPPGRRRAASASVRVKSRCRAGDRRRRDAPRTPRRGRRTDPRTLRTTREQPRHGCARRGSGRGREMPAQRSRSGRGRHGSRGWQADLVPSCPRPDDLGGRVVPACVLSASLHHRTGRPRTATRRIEVFDAEDLLAMVLQDPEGRNPGSSTRSSMSVRSVSTSRSAAGSGRRRRPRRRWPTS